MVIPIVVVGVVFSIAGASQAWRPLQFEAAVRGFPLMKKKHVARSASSLIVSAELAIGLCLVCQYQLRVAATAALGLLAFFTGVTVIALLMGRSRSNCGCIIGISTPIAWPMAFRNVDSHV